MPSGAATLISVPATSANLGPGYDCLGLAVDLWLEVKAQLSERDSFLYSGEGQLQDTPHNLSHQGFALACREAGVAAARVTFTVSNPIPLARGLGSSSAALVAGAAAADELLGLGLGRDGVFQVCARAEGHPDNVAPAVFGGFTASAFQDGKWHAGRLPLPDSWRFLFAIPERELPTVTARKAVPDSFPRADVISTSARTALWSLAVAQADAALLKIASQDVLHQPYRQELLPGFAATVAAALEAGAWAAFLSGAGPTVGAVCGPGNQAEVQAALASYGRVLNLGGASGYRISSAPAAP